MKPSNPVKNALIGLAVGDALGVPVEFESRAGLARRPVTDMTGYGTHNQPPGTWSDDAALTFCLAEALTEGFELEKISGNFRKWYTQNFWTPHGEVFDIGITTREAIYRLEAGIAPEKAGGADERENGNGSMMRILPLLFYIKDKPVEERFRLTQLVSAVTHRHIRSVIACFYYLEFARLLLTGETPYSASQKLQEALPPTLVQLGAPETEIFLLKRLLVDDISALPERDIHSSGYVLHTLEASIWCLLSTKSFREAVLKAVNLGEDTDTTGAVTGGLAGLVYGVEAIPEKWVSQLARKADIEDLAERLAAHREI